MMKVCIFLYVMLLSMQICIAESVYDYRNRSSLQVLSDRNITAITKDDHGFIWLATRSELVRFDGNTYQAVSTEINKTLFEKEKAVQCLYFSAPDLLLIGLNRGFFIYDIHTRSLTEINELDDIRVNSVFSLRETLYLNTPSGIFHFSPEKKSVESVFDLRQILSVDNLPNVASFFAPDSKGRCWFLVGGCLMRLTGLNALDDGLVFSEVKPDTVRMLVGESRMTVDKYDNMWICDRQKVTIFNIRADGTLHSLSVEQMEASALLIEDNYVFICNRGKGNIILQKDRDGKEIRREEFSVSPHFDDLASHANVFFADRDGNLWIGTRGGLFMFPYRQESPFVNIRSSINIPNTLTHNTVSDVYVEGRNTIWVGTAYGLNKVTFSGPASDNYTLTRILDDRPGENYVNNNKIEQIAIDSEGIMWLGTKAYLKFYNPRQNTYPSKPLLESKIKGRAFVRSIYRDRNNNMWLGFVDEGLFVSDPEGKNVSEILSPKGKPVSCRVITGSNNNIIWVATRTDGILRIENNIQSDYFIKKQYYPKSINAGIGVTPTALHVDKHNNIWAGTEQGLYKYNHERDTFIFMDIHYGDYPKYIVGIIDDNRGNLWLASPAGIYKYNISERTTQFIMLNTGNFARENYVFGCDICSDDYIYMGGLNGLTFFNPKDIITDTAHYNVQITDFRVHNKPVQVGSYILAEDINHVDRIKLNYTDNQFTFAFSALSYTNEYEIKYSYKLEGIDNEWNYLGTGDNNITYNNLSWGTYTLKMRCTNSMGIWQDNVKSLVIRVNPPLLLRWYFLLLYVIIVSFVVWLLYQMWSLRMKLKLQADLEDHKLKFYTDLTYNIKAPLTLLQSPLNYMKDHYISMSEEEINYMLTTMSRNSNRISLLVEKLVGFRRVTQGKTMLHLVRTDFIVYVQSIYESFKDLFASKNITFTFASNVDHLELVFDTNHMETILSNILSNAYRFTKSGGTVTIDCSLDTSDSKAWVEVIDTGVGIEKDNLNRVFDRFWTGEAGRKEGGVGIGLNLTKELVELHHGEIRVDSTPQIGTKVRFSILLGNAHFGNAIINEPNEHVLAHEHIKDYIESERIGPESVPKKPANVPLVYMADQNAQLLEFVRRTLRMTFQVKTFDNPNALYEEVLKQKPKLILSAFVFAGERKGLVLCKQIKSNPEMNDIPFMFVTSHSNDEDKKIAYECGSDAFIAKPFEIDHLEKRMQILLQSQENIREKAKREFIVNPKNIHIESADDKFLAKVISIIEKHIDDEEFTIDAFASKMNLSTSMFYRRIKSLTQLSPLEMLRSYRLKHAAKLLESKAYNVSEVASKVGFSDVRYFSICFKKEFGISPSTYQQSQESQSSEK